VRLGVIADVHGNLPALEAVLARLETLSLDHVVNLGDCASGPLWPAATVDLLRKQRMSHVRGNHDRALGSPSPNGLGASDAFAWRDLDAAARGWLASLPGETAIDGARCFHASPGNDEAYLMEEVHDGRLMPSGAATIERRLGEQSAPLLLCGHSHLPRIARLSSGAIIVNPGSVGCPAYHDATGPAHVSESGARHARFAIVTIAAGVDVELHAVDYAWEAAALQAEANGRDDWAYALRTGTALPHSAAVTTG